MKKEAGNVPTKTTHLAYYDREMITTVKSFIGQPFR